VRIDGQYHLPASYVIPSASKPVSDRKQFLQRIREQAARGRAYRVALNPAAGADAAYVGGGNDPVGSLLREWTAVGGKGFRANGIAEARRFIGEFAARNHVRSAVRWSHPLLDRIGVDAALNERGVGVRCWSELESESLPQSREALFAADLGITSVNWAVAETGTLALCAVSGRGRLASLLPPVYLAIVEPAQIIPDLFDLFHALEHEKHDLPSNLALVTGPSKTGDIELKLTTGVHGPGNVTLLIVESESC
jgi:L-lactate dehydrogenase complex protein LldG